MITPITKPFLCLKIDRVWPIFVNFKVREIRETSICRKKDMAKEEGERARWGESNKAGFRLVMPLKLASCLPSISEL